MARNGLPRVARAHELHEPFVDPAVITRVLHTALRLGGLAFRLCIKVRAHCVKVAVEVRGLIEAVAQRA